MGHLLDAAAEGDLAAAKALIPYFDQALGKPTEPVEHRHPTTLKELDSLSTAELEEIVRRGRAKRLEEEWLASDGGEGFVSG